MCAIPSRILNTSANSNISFLRAVLSAYIATGIITITARIDGKGIITAVCTHYGAPSDLACRDIIGMYTPKAILLKKTASVTKITGNILTFWGWEDICILSIYHISLQR